MSKFNVIVADPPYSFSDKLIMSDVKRGAASNYDVLSDQNIIDLPVEKIAADDAILVLWIPSSKLDIGLKIMKSWGFKQTQTLVWVKVVKSPLESLFDEIKSFKLSLRAKDILLSLSSLDNLFGKFSLNSILTINLGRLFRQSHEIALVGVRGKIYKRLKNKGLRSVIFDQNLKHSSKPEELQDRLEKMFPLIDNSHVELFARRVRKDWVTVGLECPNTLEEDIKVSLDRLMAK